MSADRFPSWPQFDADEVAAAMRVLKTGKVNYWTGEQGRQFECEYAQALGLQHALALMNGTVALELALRMWGVGPGDEVIVTPRSFMASISCVVLQGAIPVFADVDRESGNLTAATISKVVTGRTRAIIPVHLGGWPCEMDEIMSLAGAHDLKVLEDCAQSHGAIYKGRAVGSMGDAAAFSFCQDKIITTGGEGGLLSMNDEAMWARAWAFKDHGKSFDAVYNKAHPSGFRWLHESFGTNWRMTEFQAAIGRIQLGKLPEWSLRRRRNAQMLIEQLDSLSAVRIPVPAAHLRHAYYRFYAYVRPERLRSGWSRDRIVSEVVARGVPCFSGSCSEIYREAAFHETGFRPADRLPVAQELGETSIALLVHPTLTESNMSEAADVFRQVLVEAAA